MPDPTPTPIDDAARRRAWAKHGLAPPPPGTLAVGPFNGCWPDQPTVDHAHPIKNASV